jgi:hypothetical protein
MEQTTVINFIVLLLSGLLAVYVLGIVLGNSDLTYKRSIIHFNNGFAWMVQIMMFVLLGIAWSDWRVPGPSLFQILCPRKDASVLGRPTGCGADRTDVLSPKLKRQQMKELFMLLEPEAAP